MPSPKIVWIHDGSNAGMSPEWRAALSEFDFIPVTALADAHAILTRQDVDCVLVEGAVFDGDRMLVLDALREMDGLLPVVFYDHDMTAAEAVRLHRSGAFNCVGQRDGVETLRGCLEQAVEERRCQSRRRFSAVREPWREMLVGESAAMQRVADTIRLVGPRRCTVLICGESGTGKELAAKAIHMASPRAHQSFVAVNCTALPEHLLEAEMFGHTKGAFTGAVSTRVGRFEHAHKGTLFLDEIADMPLEMQAKLLRVLQDREFQRLGSSEVIKVDIRVIAASNVNLLDRVHQGRFREDLYYRLNVVPLQLPALRERDDDIPVLVYHLVQKICSREGIPVRRLAPETLASLKAFPWPGNVRQLENAVEMAIALCGDRDILYPRDLGMAEPVATKVVPIDVRTPATPLTEGVDFETAVSRFQLSMLQQALTQTGGNKTAAAELLGMKRTTLIMKLRSFEGIAV